MKKNKIWIATGGTGGHIFPAMAVVSELTKLNYKITVSTDGRGESLVKKSIPSGVKIVRIFSSGFGNKSIFSKIKAMMLVALSVLYLVIRFLFNRPKEILAFGGYPSVPVEIAGALYKIPIVLHEQNGHMGLANRLSAKFARMVLTSFENVKGIPEGVNVSYTGLPVRDEFKKASNYPFSFDGKGDFNILVTGGSLGAKVLNEVVPNALIDLPINIRKKIRLVQQVNKEQIPELSKIYAKNDIKAVLLPFINDMADQMAKANVIISRGGASAIVEIMTVGRPAIIVPLTVNPDQLANGRQFEAKGGGIVIEQNNFNPRALNSVLENWFQNPDKMKKMAMKIKTENKAIENILKSL